jgi:hypothetical protein
VNFAAAKDLADEESRGLTDGSASCPLEKTGLIVLVYGDEGDVALEKIKVTASGAEKPTDEKGLARYIPTAVKTYTVHAAVPEGRDDLIAPKDEEVEVEEGKCPVCVLHMPKGVKPQITILWSHDDSAVPRAQVELVESGAPTTPTNGDGLAAFGKLVALGTYGVKVTFEDGKAYVLFDAGSAVTTVAVQGDGKKTLKIKRQTVTFHVVEQVGKDVKELVGAKVKLEAPVVEGTTALESEEAITKLVLPVVEPEPKDTCKVASLAPDGTDDAYEVVEVTSA